jgi:hypothetical protein
MISQYRRINVGTLLTLFLKNVHIEDSNERGVLDGELLELLQEEEREEESFVWIVDLTVSEDFSIDKDRLKKEGEFFRELFETAQFNQPEQTLAALYEHPLGKKYLSSLSAEDQQQLLEKAENLLIKLLYQS